jgi:hypothetical protein
MPTLNWIGKDKVVSHHQDVPYRVLEHKYGFTSKKGEQSEPALNFCLAHALLFFGVRESPKNSISFFIKKKRE